MSFNINLNGIKNGAEAACRKAIAKAGEWSGRAVVVIRSGTEKALPYLQDKRIAAISLIAVNLLLCEFANLLVYFWNKHCPNDTALKRGVRDFISATAGIGIVATGVSAFVKYTKIPFSPLAILGISVGTIVIRSFLSKEEKV